MQGFFNSQIFLKKLEEDILKDLSPFNERMVNRVLEAMIKASSDQLPGRMGSTKFTVVPIFTVPRLMKASPAFLVLCDNLILDLLNEKDSKYIGLSLENIRTDLVKRVELVESMAVSLRKDS